MDTRSDQPGYIILTSPPIYDHFYKYCSPAALRRIARTCRGAEEAIKDYLTHALSVRYAAQLARFFPDPGDVLAFRQLQANLQFLVSGSQALQLLDRTVYPESDLDLYVWPLQARPVADWLTARGYRFVSYNEGFTHSTFEEALKRALERRGWNHPDRQDMSYDLPGVLEVFNFKKPRAGSVDRSSFAGDSGAEAVQIVVARGSPLKAILKFHATMVMNFVSWDRVVSLYPLATFEHRKALVTYLNAPGFDKAMTKYQRRGFQVQSVSYTPEPMKFPLGGRWVGDGASWTVRLSTSDINPPSPDSRWEPEVNSWELKQRMRYLPGSLSRFAETVPGMFEMHVEMVSSPRLHHCYCATRGFFRFLQSTPRVRADAMDRASLAYRGVSNRTWWPIKKPYSGDAWDHQLPIYKADYIDHLRRMKPWDLNVMDDRGMSV